MPTNTGSSRGKLIFQSIRHVSLDRKKEWTFFAWRRHPPRPGGPDRFFITFRCRLLMTRVFPSSAGGVRGVGSCWSWLNNKRPVKVVCQVLCVKLDSGCAGDKLYLCDCQIAVINLSNWSTLSHSWRFQKNLNFSSAINLKGRVLEDDRFNRSSCSCYFVARALWATLS